MTPSLANQRNRHAGKIASLIILMVMPFAVGLALLRLYDSSVHSDPPLGADGEAADIVALNNGSTLVAAPGTVARDMADWLNSKEGGSRLFNLSGHQFISDSNVLTPDSENRIDRLAMMLKANKDVTATIMGQATNESNNDLNQSLSGWRAARVRDALISRGVAAYRVSIETGNSTDFGATGDIAILLSRPIRNG